MTALTQLPKVEAAPKPTKADLWSQEASVELPDTAQLGWGVALFPVVLFLGGLLLKMM
ncbi:hypothetical protein Dxin01_02954 [Deinococcus xinjiangensis]|uniref:Uncharacterized protein n=1 Tax=Deinococcus xinjiangensis TaxID=457454 RepID=A0ABP9VD78_9DEIO